MPVKFFKAMVIFSLLALIFGFAPVDTVQAASNNNNVEWNGAGHAPGSNICGDVNFPYRAPYPTNPLLAVTIRARAYQDDLSSVDVWYTTNASAAAAGDWTRLGAFWTNNWGGCGGLGDMGIWRADIPVQSTQVWYKIALTDGTDTDWILSPGEGSGIVSDGDGGWTTASTTLTTIPPVVWVDDGYTSGGANNGHSWGYDAFATIQNGINGVAVGGTVNVAAGTYIGAVTVNKAITVQGIESAFVDATAAIINEGSVSVSGNGATFRNFKVIPGSVTGNAAAISVTASNTTVADNYITGMTGNGLGDTIKGIYIYGGAVAPPAPPSNVKSITISGNWIDNITAGFKTVDGIMVQGYVDGVNITSNTINGLNALTLARAIEVSWSGNSANLGPFNVLIQKNLIHSVTSTYPVGVLIESGTDASSTTLYANSITNINYYLANLGNGTLNASGNWFGSNIPSGFTGKFWGSVDYTPWMDVGTDLSPTSPGFQGDLSTLWVNTSTQTGTTGRIVEAANMVEDGALTGAARQVKVLTGTYTETGTISRPATVQSNAGMASTVVQNPGGTAINVASGGVTLTGFTFQNSATAVEVNAGDGSFIQGNTFTGNTTGIKTSSTGVANIDANTFTSVTGSSAAVQVDGGSANIGLTTPNAFNGKTAPYAGDGVLVSNGTAQVNGNAFKQYINGLRVTGGTLYAKSNTFTNFTNAVSVSGGLAEIGGDLWSEKNTITGGNAVAVSGGSAYVKGNLLTGSTTVFNHSAGTLNAYANSISGFTTAKSGAAVSNLKHNYWNTSSPNAAAPAGLSLEDWQARLGAPINDWAEGNGSVSLQGATLSGTGRPQIVLHGDGATLANRPFGSGKDPYVSQLCSDFYDLFAVDGTGTFDLSIPVDDKGGTLDCTTPLANRSLYWITSGTDYAAECLAFDDIRCWDSVGATKTVTINGSNLEVGGLTPVELGGTQIVIGDINGLDPTAIELIDLKVRSTSSSTDVWTASLLGMLALLAAFFIWKLRR